MFDFVRRNIRNQLLVLVASSLAVVVIAFSWGFTSLNAVIDEYSSTANNDVRYMTQLSSMNLRFKTQVQEWKNTLIRGKDPKQLDKYWNRFLDNSERIEKDYRALLSQMPRDHVAYSNLNDFASAYPPMIEAYKRGYNAYINNGFDIDAGDKAVSGIDRQPTKLLSEALKKAETQVVAISAEIDGNASNTRNWTVVVTVLAIIASMVIFVYFVQVKIIRRLDNVTYLSTQIAKGDFTHQAAVQSDCQIGQLTNSFNLIQKDLGGVVKGILDDLKELTRLIDTLFSAFHQIKDSLTDQTNETHVLIENMNNMLGNSKDINNSIDEANEFVKQSLSKADAGVRMFQDNLENSQSLMESMNNAGEIIKQVKQDSDEIGNVVSVINSIAEQTNLLALNAAIEAARAGENGRGFAVVADEVRSLANKTQSSTTQISETINGLQAATDKAVKAMQEGQSNADTSLNQAKQAQDFMESLKLAFTGISELNISVENVAAEQVNQANLVNKGLSEIERHSERSQHEAAVMEDASNVLANILKKIKETTSVFKLP